MCCWRKTWRLFTAAEPVCRRIFITGLFFEDLAQAFSGIFPDRFQFGVRPIAWGYMVAVFFAKRLDQGVAALLADFAVAVPLAAIESFRIMFAAHFSMCIAPVVPVFNASNYIRSSVHKPRKTVHSTANFLNMVSFTKLCKRNVLLS